MNNNKYDLVITLGHNASCILMGNKEIQCGYEEERISRVKSDSAFPRCAILKCLDFINVDDTINKIYISWWNDSFTIFDDPTFDDKHLDKKFLNTIIKQRGGEIVYLSEKCTHHDAHAYAALNFANSFQMPLIDTYVIVADGFGNKGEVFSLYKVDMESETLLTKVQNYYGYTYSMGLMYQYATAYVGMKMNEDEYKFLGYESHIDEILPIEMIKLIDELAENHAIAILTESEVNGNRPYHNSYINVDNLKNTQQYWNKFFDEMLFDNFGLTNYKSSEFAKRCIVARFIQHLIEIYFGIIVNKHGINNVILSGGIFYNVKLNNSIMNNISGKICVYPLAGDQGAGLGLWVYHNGMFKFDNLCIGKRYNESVKYQQFNGSQRIIEVQTREELIKTVTDLINEDKIVNVLTGHMEFGPRALCHTTTFALPTSDNVSYINKLNDRNDVMPMAPVTTEEVFNKNFKHSDKIVGSNRFMIITTDQLFDVTEHNRGICHKYPLVDVYSSRCQTIYEADNHYVYDILKSINSEYLINTSFNYHGYPICYSKKDAIINFMKQCEHDDNERNYLILCLENK